MENITESFIYVHGQGDRVTQIYLRLIDWSRGKHHVLWTREHKDMVVEGPQNMIPEEFSQSVFYYIASFKGSNATGGNTQQNTFSFSIFSIFCSFVFVDFTIFFVKNEDKEIDFRFCLPPMFNALTPAQTGSNPTNKILW